MDQFRPGPGVPILSTEIDHYYWILDRKYNLEPTLVHAASPAVNCEYSKWSLVRF